MNSLPKISVCVPASRHTTLGPLIDSILKQTLEEWELLVIGQGKNSEIKPACERIAKGDTRVSYIHSERIGTSAARNAGIAVAKSQIVAFIDDDCEADKRWLETAYQHFENDPTVDAIFGSVIAPEGSNAHFLSLCPQVMVQDAVYDTKTDPQNPPFGFGFIGCNALIRRHIFEHVGLFDEYLGPGTEFPAAEDTDFLFRLESHGTRLRSSKDVIVYHTNGMRSGLANSLKHTRNYATGNGGLAGKLTLQSDPRGGIWMRSTVGELTKISAPGKVLGWLLRTLYFLKAYGRCRKRYDVEMGLLVLK